MNKLTAFKQYASNLLRIVQEIRNVLPSPVSNFLTGTKFVPKNRIEIAAAINPQNWGMLLPDPSPVGSVWLA